MILGKSTGTLTSRQEHSLINSLHVSTKPIKSIYNAYNYNFAAHFNIAYKEYMYLHVTLKTPKHLWWKLSLHNKKNSQLLHVLSWSFIKVYCVIRQVALSQYATSYGSLIVLSIRKHAMYRHMFLWFFNVRYKHNYRESLTDIVLNESFYNKIKLALHLRSTAKWDRQNMQ